MQSDERQEGSEPSVRSAIPKSRKVMAVAVLLVVPLYFGVMSLIREHVNSEIQASVGKPVIEFELADQSGGVVRAADLRGKTVILNFFRSKCVNCLVEAPVIKVLARRLIPDKAVLLGVMMDEVQGFSKADTEATLKRLGYTHPVLMADPAFVDAFHGAGWANVTPVTYVVGPEGTIVRAFRGHQSIDDLLNALPAGSYH